MNHLWGLGFVMHVIKINLQRNRVNGKTVQRGKKTSGDTEEEREKKKLLTKAERENYLPSCLCIRKSLPESQL